MSGQRGSLAYELAWVLGIFCVLLVGISEFTQLMWVMNSANEATFVGARLAAVCDKDNAIIKQSMRQRLPSLSDANITVEYVNRGIGTTCFEDLPTNVANPGSTNVCRAVRVGLHNYSHELTLPLVPMPLPLPALKVSVPVPSFSTTLPREYMHKNNPACIH